MKNSNASCISDLTKKILAKVILKIVLFKFIKFKIQIFNEYLSL